MISNEQKNKNILSRFENKTEGTKIKKYTVETLTHNAIMICMNGATLEEAEIKARGIFCSRFVGIYE